MGLRSAVTGVDGYLDAVYFAGVGFFTVGFGLRAHRRPGPSVLVEAFMGLVTMALVIGYLPTLYGAYSRREVQLLSLDDMSDDATTPIGFLEDCYASGAARRWRRRSPSGSGGATRCSTATPPTRCWPCSAPASRARTG